MDALALLCTLHADGPATWRKLSDAGCASLADVVRHEADGIRIRSTGSAPLGPLTAGGVLGVSPASAPVLVGLRGSTLGGEAELRRVLAADGLALPDDAAGHHGYDLAATMSLDETNLDLGDPTCDQSQKLDGVVYTITNDPFPTTSSPPTGGSAAGRPRPTRTSSAWMTRRIPSFSRSRWIRT